MIRCHDTSYEHRLLRMGFMSLGIGSLHPYGAGLFSRRHIMPRVKRTMSMGGIQLWLCPLCKRWLPLKAYYKDKRTTNGGTSRCKTCHMETSLRTRDPDNTRRLRREHMRRARARNPEKFRARDRIASRRYRQTPRVLCRHALNAAVRRGDIIRPSSCSQCGCNGKIEGHHPDYSKPLSVEWYCPLCHAEVERNHGREMPE